MDALAIPQIDPGERFLRISEVVEITGISKPTLYALIARGEFPRQVKLTSGGKIAGWIQSEVLAYMQSRIEQREAGKEA